MKTDMATFTPYILFFFGLIITYIGWSAKKILENIEGTIKNTAAKVEDHTQYITSIQTDIRVHAIRIDSIEREVVEIKKNGKIEK